MIKGWRVLFYAVIAIAVLSITWITVRFILTERLVKATGHPDLAVRQRAAIRIMDRGRDRDKPIKFLQGQPQTVRNNVVWALEPLAEGDGERSAQIVRWLVEIARDMSGDLPSGDADWDASRLAVQRLGPRAYDVLLETLRQTTRKTLERAKFAHRRAVAARMLGLLGDPRAVPYLIHALYDEHDIVRQEAAAALARINTPEVQEPLRQFLEPLFGVLEGRYICYVRADSEGVVKHDPNRDDLLYGPFEVQVKPYEQATAEDLARQRDSAELIEKREEERKALTRKRLEEGRQGQVIRRIRGDTDLAIEKVRISRTGLKVEDPIGKHFSLIEGEPMEIEVDVINRGPGDLSNDFFVTLYAASPRPRNHPDRPSDDGPYAEFAGERARDMRALAGTAEQRHVQTMFHADRPETPDKDDSRDSVWLNFRFTDVESDRVKALRQLMNVGHEMAVPALGQALGDTSYTVRRMAAAALERILMAHHTSAEARAQIVAILQQQGLTSADKVVRCTAAEALGAGGDASSVAALHALLLNDDDPTVRLVAQRALAELPSVASEKMLPALVSNDPGARLVAPRLFHREGDEDVARRLIFSPDREVAREVLRSSHQLLGTEHLVAALALPDPRARAMAARYLAERQDPLARDALLRALGDSEGKVREAAARGLGLLLKAQKDSGEAPDPEIVTALVQVVDNEKGDYVGYAPDEKPEDPTTAVTTDKRTRAAAVEALVGIETPEATKALTDALQDKNPDVLAAVIPAVEKGQVKYQTARLIAIIEDTKTMPARVRQAAELAIWRSDAFDANIEDPAAKKDEEAEPAADAAEAKKPKKPEPPPREKALDALVGLLNDPNDAVKTAAAVALIGMGDSRGNKVLKDQVQSKSPDVRRQAATLLATLPPDKVASIEGLKEKDRDGLNILFEDLYLTGSLPVNFRFLCRSLVFLGDEEETRRRLKAAVDDAHPVLRAAAVTVLAELDDEAAAEAVKRLLGDANEVARAAAVDAAAVLGLVEVRPRIEALIKDQPDPSQTVRDRATQALLNLADR